MALGEIDFDPGHAEPVRVESAKLNPELSAPEQYAINAIRTLLVEHFPIS